MSTAAFWPISANNHSNLEMQTTDFKILYSCHPEDLKGYDTDKLRQRFLMSDVMCLGKAKFTYSMNERLLFGGIMPTEEQPIKLEPIEPLKAEYFLECREMGIINIGGKGCIAVDGEDFLLENKDALYIGRGHREIILSSVDPVSPAKYYFNSAPAHCSYKTQLVTLSGRDDTIKANSFATGSLEQSNYRTINQMIVKGVLQEGPCQLQMGITELRPGSVWNTMPAHTHDRRAEVYFHFGLMPGNVVCHIMGEPHQSRLIWAHDQQAVMSPEWSLHAGAGTAAYSFIWGMAGENLDYGDMNKVDYLDLK